MDEPIDQTESTPCSLSPQTCRLLDLPAEVRLLIYDEVLIQNGPVWLEGCATQITAFTCGPWPHVFSAAPPGSGLLRASKQIYQETNPIIYGANCFHPESEETLKLFLKTIGTSVRYISAIDLGFTFTYPSARAAFHLLEEIPHLRKIYLEMSQLICCVRGLTRSEDPGVWARFLANEHKEFLLSMQARNQLNRDPQRETWDPADVIQFRIKEVAPGHDEESVGKVEGCAASFRSLVCDYLVQDG